MRGSGVAIMGTATAEGDDRAKLAVDEALNSPLLEENDIRGAQHILLNITSGTREVTMDEIFEITEFVQEEAGYGTDLIWGNCFDESLGDKIAVTIIATGFEHNNADKKFGAANTEKVKVSLDDETPMSNKSIADLGYTETTSKNTVEFEDVRESLTKYRRSQYSYDEPYIKPEDKERIQEECKVQEVSDTERRDRLRSLNTKLNNPQTIKDLENEPAYVRRKVNLEDVQHSSEDELSSWSIGGDDGRIELTGNSYLHDNVD